MPYTFNPFTGNFDYFVASPTGAALTEVDDTNVTLTLGGTPTTALLAAVSITAGWTGTLAVGRGGTGAGSFTSNGVLYGNGTSALQVTAQGAANSVLTANAGAPSFSQTPVIQTSITVPTVYGGSGASGNLVLQSTSNSTRGTVNLPDLLKVATDNQSFGATNPIYVDVGTGTTAITTGAVTALRYASTVTVGGNSASTIASLFNAAFTVKDDGTARTLGPALIFANQPVMTATIAGGLTLNDLAGVVPTICGLYHGPTLNRTGAGTGTAQTVCGLYISSVGKVDTGFTVTNWVGMLIDKPTVNGTLTNFYGVKNNGAAATNYWFLYETGGMQSSHKGNLRLGDNTAPTALLDIQGTINTNQTTANGTVATAMSNLGPTGSHTTIQEWLTIKINGTTRYVPCF